MKRMENDFAILSLTFPDIPFLAYSILHDFSLLLYYVISIDGFKYNRMKFLRLVTHLLIIQSGNTLKPLTKNEKVFTPFSVYIL